MKTVVVTGGTTRLGRIIADRLIAAGWGVLRSSHRPEAGADFVADLAAPEGAALLFQDIRARLAGEAPFALVNNAALFTGSDDAIRRVDFEAPVALMRLMAEQARGGCVVNILDAAVLAPVDSPLHAARPRAYTEAKRALADETRRAARVYGGALRVNAVAPGPVLAPTGVHEKAGDCPLGRPTPEAVAEAVAFLLSASYTTGVILPVDGGTSMRGE